MRFLFVDGCPGRRNVAAVSGRAGGHHGGRSWVLYARGSQPCETHAERAYRVPCGGCGRRCTAAIESSIAAAVPCRRQAPESPGDGTSAPAGLPERRMRNARSVARVGPAPCRPLDSRTPHRRTPQSPSHATGAPEVEKRGIQEAVHRVPEILGGSAVFLRLDYLAGFFCKKASLRTVPLPVADRTGVP